MFALSMPKNDSVMWGKKKTHIATSAVFGALLSAGDADYHFKKDNHVV